MDIDVGPLVDPEVCDHRDDFGSTILSDRLCMLCNRTIPPTPREALSHSWWYLVWSIKAAFRR